VGAPVGGEGSKGHRWYSWAIVDILPEPDGPDLGSGHHTLLVRRNDTTGELAWYRCWTPRPVPVRDLVHVAGRRWTVETCQLRCTDKWELGA
jgi:hypothetical protein